mgnify:CR=1 FL=1
MAALTPAELRQAILCDFERLMEHIAQWRQVGLLDVDVTMPQARCLMFVGLRPALPISALASHLRIGLPAASGLVERLVEAGYVERSVDPLDRRHHLLTLSERGRALVDRFHELSSERLGDLLRGLSAAELQGLCLGVAALEREARTYEPPTEPTHPQRTSA